MALLEKFWTVIKPLRSSVKERIPTTAAVGELAVNDADGIMYLKKEDDTFVEWESNKEYIIFSQNYQKPDEGQKAGDDIWYKVGGYARDLLGVFKVEYTEYAPLPHSYYQHKFELIIDFTGGVAKVLQSHYVDDINFRFLNKYISPGTYNNELYINVSRSSAIVSVTLKQIGGYPIEIQTSTTPVSLADIPNSYPPIILNENYIPGVGIEMIKNEGGKIVVNSIGGEAPSERLIYRITEMFDFPSDAEFIAELYKAAENETGRDMILIRAQDTTGVTRDLTITANVGYGSFATKLHAGVIVTEEDGIPTYSNYTIRISAETETSQTQIFIPKECTSVDIFYFIGT